MWQCLSSIRWNSICITNSVLQWSSNFEFSKLERARDQILLVVETCTSKVFAAVETNPLRMNPQLLHLWAPKEARKQPHCVSLMIAPSLVAFQELIVARVLEHSDSWSRATGEIRTRWRFLDLFCYEWTLRTKNWYLNIYMHLNQMKPRIRMPWRFGEMPAFVVEIIFRATILEQMSTALVGYYTVKAFCMGSFNIKLLVLNGLC